MAEIPNNHLGGIKPSKIMGFQLPTSTGEFAGFSEPSTVRFLKIHNVQSEQCIFLCPLSFPAKFPANCQVPFSLELPCRRRQFKNSSVEKIWWHTSGTKNERPVRKNFWKNSSHPMFFCRYLFLDGTKKNRDLFLKRLKIFSTMALGCQTYLSIEMMFPNLFGVYQNAGGTATKSHQILDIMKTTRQLNWKWHHDKEKELFVKLHVRQNMAKLVFNRSKYDKIRCIPHHRVDYESRNLVWRHGRTKWFSRSPKVEKLRSMVAPGVPLLEE